MVQPDDERDEPQAPTPRWSAEALEEEAEGFVLPEEQEPVRYSDLDIEQQRNGDQQPQAPQTDLTEEAEGFTLPEPHPFDITIDGKQYPCVNWQTVDEPRILERRYDEGFNGGMGIFNESHQTRPGQIYHCVNLDPTTFPYIRMRRGERDATALTVTNADAAAPAYGFVMEGPSNVEYLYICNGAYIFKINLGAGGTGTPAFAGATPTVAEATKTINSGAGTAGRPVYFEGKWYVPFGDATGGNANYVQRLDTVAADDIANDTWTALDYYALHLGKMMNEGVAQLWRAHTTNLIDGAGDPSAVANFGDDFEAGDSGWAVTDILSIGGELFVSKPDRPYRFDSQGNSIPALEFIGPTGGTIAAYPQYDGSCSGAVGPTAYWAHSSGLWRIVGDMAAPVDPFSHKNWTGIGLDSITPTYNTYWMSFAAWGRWAYATNKSDGVYVGWIEDNGYITWMANILSAQQTAWTAGMRCGIAVTSTNPILWVLDDTARFAIFDLALDGSMREVNADGYAHADRGGDNEIGQIWMPNTNLGSEKKKQIRLMWVDIDNNEYANLEVEAYVHRDRNSTSTQLGSSITSADGPGHFEFEPNSQSANISSSSLANPTVITTSTSHGLQSGDIVTIVGHDSVPAIDGDHVITWISTTTFSIPVNVTTGGGAAGTVTSKRDTFFQVMPAIRFDTNQAGAFAPATADPRIAEFGIRAVTPHIYQATIPLLHDTWATRSMNPEEALIRLRDLKSGASVLVREPADHATFTGYIRNVREQTAMVNGVREDVVVLTIERWSL